MFEIRTDDPARLKRIVAAGGGALLLGLFILVYNLIGPLVTGMSYGTENVVFGLFGVFVVLLATYPTNSAAEKLDSS
jgi:hypothetical protein